MTKPDWAERIQRGRRKAFEEGTVHKTEAIINLLKENSKCTLDGGHDTNGYCFCEAIDLIKETANGAA